MSENFIPFQRREITPASSAKNGNSSSFTPATSADKPSPNCNKPVVTLKKDGQKITQIQIQCSCGQIVELDCAY